MFQLRINIGKMEKEYLKLSKWFHAPKNIGVINRNSLKITKQ